MEDSGEWSAFIEACVLSWGQTFKPPNHHSETIPQTIISVKPSYAGFGHYILSCKVCQAHLLHKKIPRNQGEIVDNRNVILTNLYTIYRKPG